MANITVSSGIPYPFGAYAVSEDSANFAFATKSLKVSLKLYDKANKKSHLFELNSSNKTGDVYHIRVNGIDVSKTEYSYIVDGEEVCDSYSKLVVGNNSYGKMPDRLTSKIIDDKGIGNNIADSPCLDFANSIFYLIHVRGFTKHKSSNVTFPGTFRAVTEKIDYLKNLGITTLELMPSYEFVECSKSLVKEEPVINYWGYKDAYYMAPKASYAGRGTNACEEFAYMVNEFHKASMEVIMQVYFSNEVKPSYILDVLRYWVITYKIDGFHLMGENMPLTLICTDALLSNTKIMYYGFPVGEIYGNSKPVYKNLAMYNDDAMYSFRRFLKSDEHQLDGVISQMKDIDERLAKVHYITNCNGFTLNDLVSYDRKHNMDNGENDRDGNPYNASWNCGVEGPTVKRSILKLRRKQIKNAILFNVLSQSTPMILAGDEFLNSQKGNNNPYCIDGPLTWLNWNDLKKNQDIFDFYKEAIAFRNNNRILHMNRPLRMTDYLLSGYPDLSFHSQEAWKLEKDGLTRHFAMLYSTRYAGVDINGKETEEVCDDEYIYVAVNMHWVNHEFAIPKLPKGKKWYVVMDTGSDKTCINKALGDLKELQVKDRSIVVLMTK